MSKVYEFYSQFQDELEKEWEEYLADGEWGSGEDKINITDKMFWEFIEDRMEDTWNT